MSKITLKAVMALGLLGANQTATAQEELIALTPECETALALAGGPKNIREGAGVYILGPEKFELVKEKKNNFICIVPRRPGIGLSPQCLDEITQKSHLPVYLDEGRKLREGKSFAEIAEERKEGFEEGIYQVPTKTGVSYMASNYNYRQAPDGRYGRVAAHVMYTAPYTKPEDIGYDRDTQYANHGLPYVNAYGPLGFFIADVEKPTDSTDVIKACAGQLPSEDEMVFQVPPLREEAKHFNQGGN